MPVSNRQRSFATGARFLCTWGGAVLTEQYLSKWYHDKLLRFDGSDATRKIQAVEANAVGGIRLAKMRLNKA